MSEEWQYQVRINLNEERAETARLDAYDASLSPLGDILAKHNATLKCQYDAFAGYCEAAEAEGIDQYPLYQWTKDTIDDPVKKAKYLKAFTLYVDGDEVYDGEKAHPLKRTCSRSPKTACSTSFRNTTPIRPTIRNRRKNTANRKTA